jgi:transcription antitermination factor NusG
MTCVPGSGCTQRQSSVRSRLFSRRCQESCSRFRRRESERSWRSAETQPISEREAARYFGGGEAAKAAPKREIHVDYEIGDQVKVNAGPFASFNGVVEELDYEKQRVKVSVSIFGRATPVELGFEEVALVK